MRSKRSPSRLPTVLNLSEEDGIRYLHFGSEWVQGGMFLKRPYDLVLEYTRHMMRWRSIVPTPRHIVQLGLGTGSLAKACYRAFPDSKLTVVEHSEAVLLAAAQHFRLPPLDRRFRVEIADAGDWVDTPTQAKRCDVLLIDLYDAKAQGPVLDSEHFYRQCKALLRRGGVAMVNVFGEGHGFETSFAEVFAAFEGNCMAFEPCESGNRVIVALR